jgi:hypothetical protein
MLRSRNEAAPKKSLIVADDRTQEERDRGLVALLDTWLSATEAEKQDQRETWETLRVLLDEDRTSDRTLFR